MVSGGMSRSNQINVGFACAQAGRASRNNRPNSRHVHQWSAFGASDICRRFSSNGSVITQPGDLLLVVAKIVQYLRIVFTKLRPDPFGGARCL
jgi:hypothetical protein